MSATIRRQFTPALQMFVDFGMANNSAHYLGTNGLASYTAMGFASLRGECPMDLGAPLHDATLSEATGKDIRRIVALWNGLLERFGGPWLGGGEWGIADAFFTPVATRFRSYGVALSDYGDEGGAGAYAERLLSTPEFLDWEAAALADVRP